MNPTVHNNTHTWRTALVHTKTLLVLAVALVLNLGNSQAQSITLVPNPDANIQQSALTSGEMTEYNGNLYYKYTNAAYNKVLAKYDGTTTTLLTNPEAGSGYYGSPIVYGGNLYFCYLDVNYVTKLAKYDGTSITLITSPDAGSVASSLGMVIHGGNLYFGYQDASSKSRLAKFDGTTITLAPNPDAGYGYSGSTIVWGGNLYFNYYDAASKYRLAKYDGTSITLFTNPDAGNGVQGYTIVYGANLYFSYQDVASKLRLAKYDGTSITLSLNPDAGTGVSGSSIVYAGNLYFSYRDVASKYRLAKYDGTSITLVTNPDAGPGGFITPIIYAGNLYYKYLDVASKYRLAKYDGTSTTLVTNPDAGSGFDTPVIYGGNLYFTYSDATNNGRLAKYDGSTISLATNPLSTAGGVNNIVTITAQNTIAMSYQKVKGAFPSPNEFSLAVLNFCTPPTVNLASQTNVVCNGASTGTAQVVASGTAPFTYAWSPSGGTDSIATALPAGSYTCIVTNACGADTQMVTITQPTAIASAQALTLCGGQSVTVGANTYSTSGIYTDVLTATNGCDSTVTTTLSITTINPFTTQPANATLNTGANANFSATSTTASPSYQWQTNAANLGWANVNNNTTYAGATTNALQVSAVALANHLQQFRLIQYIGLCADTSTQAHIAIGDTCVTTVIDTTYIPVNDTTYISVTDTLIVTAMLTGVPAPNNSNVIKIWPNPTPNMLQVNTGNYALMSGYTITITNTLAQTVYTTPIAQQNYTLDVATWTGAGTYYLTIKDNLGNVVSTKKIIVQ
ncbi:MAG: T9SS type A sorting domain-containing protein [Bacteroidia bacterium]